jgi:hypothetical protein
MSEIEKVMGLLYRPGETVEVRAFSTRGEIPWVGRFPFVQRHQVVGKEDRVFVVSLDPRWKRVEEEARRAWPAASSPKPLEASLGKKVTLAELAAKVANAGSGVATGMVGGEIPSRFGIHP